MSSHRLRIGMVLLVTALTASCGLVDQAVEKAPKPTARLLGADIRNLGLNSLDLVFDVEISNPYGAPLPLVELGYALASGKRRILAGGIKPSDSIPANGSKVLQLPARLSFANVLKVLTSIQPGSVVPYQAEINIALDAPLLGKLNVPLRHEGEIPIPAIPEVFIASIEVKELGLDLVSGNARLWITNRNEFQIDVSQLGFTLDLSGKRILSTGTKQSKAIPPGKSITLDVPVSFAPKELGTGVIDLLFKDSTAYGLSGTLDIGTRFGPLSFPITREGETMLLR